MIATDFRQRHLYYINVSFEWGISSGKEIEAFNDRISLVSERNLMDYHKRRWKLMRWLALIPSVKNGYGNRIVHIAFR